MSILHQRVTIIRKLKGLSVYAVEKGADIGVATLKNWKTSTPSSDKVLRVAQFLDVSVDYLLGNTDNPQSHKNNPQDLAKAAEKLAAEAQALCNAASLTQSNMQLIIDTCHVSPQKTESEEVAAAPVSEKEQPLPEDP